MFKQYFSTSVFLLFILVLPAQNNSHIEEYLEEKIRDTQIRSYLEKRLESKTSQSDLEKIQEYYNSRKKYSQEDNKLIQEGAEPHIVIHPTNKKILALAFMNTDPNNPDYPVYISKDAGNTWTKSLFNTESALNSTFSGNMVLGGGDPILAFDKDGTLHMSYIYVHGDFTNLRGDMFYVYSTDTGKTFTIPPIEDHVVYQGDVFASDMLDRQWMDIDNTGGPYDGNLYMSAFYFGGALMNASAQLVLTKEPDSSRFNLNNFATGVLASSGTFTQFGNVKVDQKGRLHLSCVYVDQITSGGFVIHTISTDGGKTFSSPTQVGTGDLLAPQGGTGSNSTIHDRENAAVSMAVDGDYVYIVWTDLANNSSKAYYAFSNDGGASFSQQVEFGNDLIDSSTFHFMPNVSADSGFVTISWYSVDKVSGITNYYMAEFEDSGATFNTHLMVSDTSSSFVGANAFYGDYNSSVKNGCTTWSVWADGRSGAPEIYIAKTRLCDYTAPVASITEFSPISQDFQVGSLWPNPANDFVNIELQLTNKQVIQVDIYDLQGKFVKSHNPTVQKEGSSILNLNISELSSGQYLLKITGEKGVFATRKLFKQ